MVNIIQRFLPFHKLFFIPVEVAEENACYCCRVLEGKNGEKLKFQFTLKFFYCSRKLSYKLILPKQG